MAVSQTLAEQQKSTRTGDAAQVVTEAQKGLGTGEAFVARLEGRR